MEMTVSLARTGDVPDHVPRELVVDFDYLHDPLLKSEPQQAYLRLQGAPPLVYTPRNGGHWIATRQAVMTDIFLTPEIFSNFPRIIPRTVSMATPQPFSDIDPPHNQKYRRLLTQALGRKGAKSFEEHARTLMIELVEEVLPEGRCEFVARVAQKLPIFVIMRWLDLPFADRLELLEKADDIMGHADPAMRKAGKQFVIDYVDTIVTERRAKPGADFISFIANGEVEDRPVTHEEARSMVANLVIGGLDTVRNMMCFFAIFLARNAGHRQALVDDPGLIPAAVEELLRWIPNPNMSRSITRDIVFHDVQLRQGDMVLMPLILSARDDAVYAHADEVDFARGRQRTLTFGTGGHMCPGMNLATIELNLFLEEWLKRIPHFHIDPAQPPVTRGGIMLGVDELQLVWEA